MMLPAAPPASAAPGFPVFWTMLGRIVAKLMGDRTHGDVIITMKDGSIQLIRVHTSYLPGQLPRIP